MHSQQTLATFIIRESMGIVAEDDSKDFNDNTLPIIQSISKRLMYDHHLIYYAFQHLKKTHPEL
jgi:hypothetical protein